MGNTNVCCPIPWDVSHGIPRGMTFPWTSLRITPSGYTLYWKFFHHSRFLSNLRLPWKNRVALKFFTVLNILFIIQDFWATCVCPENRVCPGIFQLYWIYFYHSGFLSNSALARKFLAVLNVLLHSGVLSNLHLPWKTKGALNSLNWICIFYHSGFLSKLRLPWKQSLPWNFSSPGGRPPPPTPRLVRLCSAAPLRRGLAAARSKVNSVRLIHDQCVLYAFLHQKSLSSVTLHLQHYNVAKEHQQTCTK